MSSSRLYAASAILIAAASGIASAQGLPEGRLYAFHSGPQSGCPGLDWHVVANGSQLTGMISWNNMQDMAHATGTVNVQARTFQMTAKEVGGQGRTATITGSVEPNGWLLANISGSNVNCKAVKVQWFSPSAAAGAGG